MRTAKHIETIRKELTERAKAKRERIDHFKNGGMLADLKPKFKHVSRPF